MRSRAVGIVAATRSGSNPQTAVRHSAFRPAAPATITAPTLVIVGDGEMPTLADQGSLMARSIGGARLHVISGAGHIVNIEQPEAYARVVQEWLRTH